MKPMAAVLRRELRVQWRSGLPLLYLGMPLLWILIARLLPASYRSTAALIGIYSDPVMMGVIFTGAFSARERDEGLYEVWAASPMSVELWLFVRFLVIAVEGSLGGLILALGAGIFPNLILFLPSIFFASGSGVLIGLILARPFRDILSYFVVGGIGSAVICLPVAGAYLRPSVLWILSGPVWPGWAALAGSVGLPAGGISAPFTLAVLILWCGVLFLCTRQIYYRAFFRRSGFSGEILQ